VREALGGACPPECRPWVDRGRLLAAALEVEQVRAEVALQRIEEGEQLDTPSFVVLKCAKLKLLWSAA